MFVINIFYLTILLILLVSSLFIVYHIVRFSYSKFAMMFMLMLFVCVAGVLIVANMSLFFSIDFGEILSSLM